MIPVGCVEECPGCRYRTYSETQSDQKKNQFIAQMLHKHLTVVQPILTASKRLFYRKRSVLHARFAEGGWHFGMIKWLNRREEIFVHIPDCPTHDPFVNQIARVFRNYLKAKIPLHFLLVSGKSITLVLKQKKEAIIEEQLQLIAPELEKVGAQAFLINWNPGAGNRVLSSKDWSLLWGKKFIFEEGVYHGPAGFRQQITQMEDAALDLAQAFLGKAPAIVDLYCGLGLSLRRWQQQDICEILGVELVKESCEAAAMNAPKAQILIGRVQERIPQLAQFTREKEFVIYTNPPRMGHGLEVNNWINRSGAEKIAYLSCNMKSLAQDLEGLDHYQVKKIQPFDFFPQTDHVEALSLLERR